ncbi:MAG TPA: DUF3376 domain-containing protein, partial [Acidimicrobiia bacterium]
KAQAEGKQFDKPAVPSYDTPEWRRQIYSARFTAEVLIAARDRLILRLVSDTTGADPLATVRRATERLGELVDEGPMPTDDPRWETWEQWAEQLAHRVTNALGAGAPPTASWPDDCTWRDDAFDRLWDYLGAIADEIAGSGAPAPHFETLAPTPGSDGRARLAQAEMVLGPLRTEPLAGSSDIGFATISAANRSPLEVRIFGEPLTTDDRVSRKLSGDQVANFASFLSARWRATDWTWGRLDAARSLVEAVANDSPPPYTVEQLHTFFVDVSPGPHSVEWTALLSERWEERQANPDTEVNSGNLRERTVDLVTERLQWEILAEEIPVVTMLQARKELDRPPTETELASVRAHGRCAPPEPAQLMKFGEIGSENVVALLSRRDLRRTVMRVGLVAWRSIQPSGTRWRTKIFRTATGMTVKPFVWVPALLAVGSPWRSMGAAILTWLGVAIATNRLVTLPAVPLILFGIVVSAWILAWEWSKRSRAPDGPGPLPYVIAGVLTVALLAFPVVVHFVNPDAHLHQWSDWVAIAGATALIAAAVLLILWWIVPKAR